MRRVAVVAAVVLMLGMMGIPAQATHPGCAVNPTTCGTVILFEGGGAVCASANTTLWSALKPAGAPTSPNCTYYNDAFWPSPLPTVVAQGLYAPRLGPPAASGASTFSAGTALNPPTSYCIDAGGSGCLVESATWLTPGVGSGLGAYCGSSRGRGKSRYTSTAGVQTVTEYEWKQSAATVLPIVGEVVSSSRSGDVGATVLSFVSSRGGAGAVGSCGISGSATSSSPDPTKIFRVEAVTISF